MNKLAKVFTAELIGTFVFLGVIIHVVSKNQDYAWIKIGLTLSVAILFLGSVSGGKFNPAVSFMFLVAEKTPMSQFLVECGAQIVGALLALYLYKIVIR
jgi:glycerol uptake facilitator-like aquaporin